MGQNIKVKLGKKAPKIVHVPDTDGIMEHSRGESLMFFGVSKFNQKNYRMCYGIGSVVKISKGDKFDVVYMKFGLEKQFRRIIVIHNQARRQLMTLKRGHITSFYGYGYVYVYSKEVDGKKVTRPTWALFAYGFQDWYTPRTIEIKKEWSDNEDVEPISEELEKDCVQYLDQFDITGDEK